MTTESSPVVRLHVATGDPDLATSRFQQAFPAIRLTPTPGGPAFGFDFRRVGDGRLAVDRLLLSGSAVSTGSTGDSVSVARVRSGRFELEYGSTRIDTTTAYLRPPGRSVARMADVHLEMVELDPEAFRAAARALLEGSGSIAMLPDASTSAPMTPALATGWGRIADLAADLAFDAHAFASPLLRAGVFELVVSGLLTTFPLVVEVGAATGRDVGPATIRRAIAYIDAHLAEPLDVASIAEAAGVPVRTLQAGFHQHLGVPPLEHLRVRRLAAAHQDLLDADPAGSVGVAEVAHRWGFAHLARFAERYRQAYGEKPSETLRR